MSSKTKSPSRRLSTNRAANSSDVLNSTINESRPEAFKFEMHQDPEKFLAEFDHLYKDLDVNEKKENLLRLLSPSVKKACKEILMLPYYDFVKSFHKEFNRRYIDYVAELELKQYTPGEFQIESFDS